MRAVVAVIVITIGLSHVACDGGSNLTGGGNAGPSERNDPKVVKNNSIDAKAEQRFTESFTISAIRKKKDVDIAWFIDTSGSMNEEVVLVKENISKFITEIKQISDIRMAMYLRTSGIGENFSNEFAGYESTIKQFNANVESWDSLHFAMAALCPASQTTATLICNQAGLYDGVVDDANLQLMKGTADSFFRKNSKKVIVVVTDDKVDDGLDIATFKNALPADMDFSVSAFAITPNTQYTGTCTPATTNAVKYAQVAKETEGKIYDLCDPDWSKHFSALVKQVKDLVEDEVKLKVEPTRVVEVKLDGSIISGDYYKIDGRKITVDESIIGKSNELTITYYGKGE